MKKLLLLIVLLCGLALLCAGTAAASTEVTAEASALLTGGGLTIGDVSCTLTNDMGFFASGSCYPMRLSFTVTGPEDLHGLYLVDWDLQGWTAESLREKLDAAGAYWRYGRLKDPTETVPFVFVEEEELLPRFTEEARSYDLLYLGLDEELNEVGWLLLRVKLPAGGEEHGVQWHYYMDEIVTEVGVQIIEAEGVELGEISCLQYSDPLHEDAYINTELRIAVTGPETVRGLYWVSAQGEDFTPDQLRLSLDNTLDYMRRYGTYSLTETAPFVYEETHQTMERDGHTEYVLYAAVDAEWNELGYLLLCLDYPDYSGAQPLEEDWSYEGDFPEEPWPGEGTLLGSGCCGAEGDGTNVSWTLRGWIEWDESGLGHYKCQLTISGTGAMADYRSANARPWDCSSAGYRIEKLVVEEGVTRLGDRAFAAKSREEPSLLQYARLPESLTSIGCFAFFNSCLRSITIPDAVTELGVGAFAACELERVRLPAGLTEIPESAFDGCPLEKVYIPDGVVSIGHNAFNGNIFLAHVRFPDSLREIGDAAFAYCYKLEAAELPAGLDRLGEAAFMSCGLKSVCGGVREIGYGAFEDCHDLREVTLLPGLESVGWAAFRGCGMLRSLALPEGLVSVGVGAFEDCARLRELTIPATVTELREDALRNTPFTTETSFWENGLLYVGPALIGAMEPLEGELSVRPGTTVIADLAFTDPELLNGQTETICFRLTRVTLPEGLVSIGAGAFFGCETLTELSLPSTLRRIGNGALAGCLALTELTLPEGMEELETDALAACGIREITLPAGLRRVGERALRDCFALQRVTFSEGVEEIGAEAFAGCGELENISLPESLVRIGSRAFMGCGLRSLRLPAGVTELGEAAFMYCGQLSAVEADPANACFASQDGVLFTKDGSVLLFCPMARAGRYTVPAGVKEIAAYAFYGSDLLTELLFPEGLEVVGDCAFAGCRELRGLALPASVLRVGKDAFNQCGWWWDESKWENDVLYLGDVLLAARYGVPSNVTVQEGTRLIADEAFAIRPDVTELTFPESLAFVGDRAFYACENLHTLRFAAPSVRFGEDAFSGASVFLLWLQEGEGPGWESLMAPQPYTHAPGAILLPAAEPTPGPLPAAEELTPQTSQTAYGRLHSSMVESTLTDEGDGSFTRVEYTAGAVTVERYDGQYRLLWKTTLPAELPLWGGYYAGEEWNFLVFGRENNEEDNAREVLRVVRYTKRWERVDSVSLYGANTTLPFRSGSLRMVQSGDLLYIHSCHQMYTTGDGKRHQANMSLIVHIPAMRLFRWNFFVANPEGFNYVSHSFDQFVLKDGERIVWLDHGDAYPRALTLWLSRDMNGPGLEQGERRDLYAFGGETGDNETGASVGGFEASATHYLTAGVSIDQSRFGSAEQRNVFVIASERSAGGKSTLRWLTSYAEGGPKLIPPRLVKLSEGSFLLLWAEWENEYAFDAVLHWLLLDGEGRAVSPEYTSAGQLSDCKPVFSGGLVRWYVTDGGAPVFYELDPAAPASVRTVPATAGVLLPGDLDGDGSLSPADARLLFRTVSAGTVQAAADLNGDGKVNNKDALLLFRAAAARNM